MDFSLKQLPSSALLDSPWQPPGRSSRKLEELAASIQKNGLLENLLVRTLPDNPDQYELISGHRRRAALESQWTQGAPELVLICQVYEGLSDEDARAMFYISNAQRSDLTPMEEAREFGQMRSELGWDADEIARRTGKSRSTVYKRLSLLRALPAVQKMLEDGVVALADAERFSMLSESVQTKALEALETATRNNADHENNRRFYLLKRFTRPLGNAPWDVSDAALDKTAGACTACPKRLNAQLSLFGDGVGSDDFCLDDECWASKFDAQWKREQKRAAVGNWRAIEGKEAKDLFPHGSFHCGDPRYTALEADCYEDTSSPVRTYKEIVGTKVIPWAVVRTETDIYTVARTSELEDVLLEMGVIKKKTEPSEPSRKGKRKASSEAQGETREPDESAGPPVRMSVPSAPSDEKLEAALGKLHAELATKGQSVHALRLLASMLLGCLELTRRPCERRGLEPTEWTLDGIKAALTEWLREQDDNNAVLGFCFELAYDATNERSAADKPEGMEAVARFLGLSDEPALEESVDALDEWQFDQEKLDEAIRECLAAKPMSRFLLLEAVVEALSEEGRLPDDEIIEAAINALIEKKELAVLSSGSIALQLSMKTDPPAPELTHVMAAMPTGKRGRPAKKPICEIEAFDRTVATALDIPAHGPSCASCKAKWDEKPKGKKKASKAAKEVRA